MIEINNFEEIKPLLNFNEEAKNVILVWVVKRNKDGNTETRGNNKNRTIKSYHFQTMEELNKKQEEIIALCKEFNCRAYISVNAKPMINVLFTLQSIVMENIKTQLNNGNSMLLRGMLDSAVMKSGTSGDKMWVVDIDTKDKEYLTRITDRVNQSRSKFTPNVVIKTLDTAHGYHLITHPFDPRLFSGESEMEIKKEGLTLLYAYLNE